MDLYGREWLEAEYKNLQNLGLIQPQEVLQVDGIQNGCNRCLNKEANNFSAFVDGDENIRYCRICLDFGLVSNRTKLYRSLKRLKVEEFAGELDVDFQLSPLQQRASEFAKSCLRKNGTGMIWAVCGAGKTEMMFESISEALKNKRRVCWAIPRTDVVIELLPRLKKAFPNASVVGLYGDSKEKMAYGDIVVSTVHQLIRFYEAFGLLIIDEVDAFPYTFDKMLPRVAKKACQKTCATLYLSATPSKADQAAIKKGQLDCCMIPARFHLHPLDIPKFKWLGSFQKAVEKGRIPLPLKRWFQEKIKNGRRALLFVPTIKSGQQLQRLLVKKLNLDVELVYSSDEGRATKVQRYKEGKGQFLLTTMILERGVTIPNIDVAILGAEHRVYEESALVQISGRVGRSPKFPSGEIVFFHYGITKAMSDARAQIALMNRLAKKEGLHAVPSLP